MTPSPTAGYNGVACSRNVAVTRRPVLVAGPELKNHRAGPPRLRLRPQDSGPGAKRVIDDAMALWPSSTAVTLAESSSSAVSSTLEE